MCGIAGIVNITRDCEAPSIELMERMVSTIRHRGPDEFGVYRDDRAGLVHARLSIIDLTSGQQPLANEDGTLWIVFNGEIFNFVELRMELEHSGHRFRTHSDTEVILHAYESWGEKCFERFNGQWALAIWDSARRSLLLSRDRVGVRPLYIHERNGRVWFASEVKALFADPSIPRQIDPHGLNQIFKFWAPLAPTSVFAGIEELPPGRIRIYKSDGTRTDRTYWTPMYPSHDAVEERQGSRFRLAEAAEILREKLMRATELRVLRSDVPVGSYLSGGLDSSVIAWMGRAAKAGEFRTFSIRFADAEFDETKFQRMMVARLDSSHEECIVTRNDIATVFPAVILHTERPILRTAPAPLFILSRLVREAGFKAVLTGEGADEMVAGYDIFREAKIRTFLARQPDSKIRQKLFDRLYPYLARSPQRAGGMAVAFWKRGLENAGMPGFSHGPRWSTTSSLKRFFSSTITSVLEQERTPDILDQLPDEFSSWDPLAQAQYLEIVTLLSGYILSSQGDRMLMAHSVEGRFPFLDVDVMEFCNGLPAEYKLIGLDEKKILKEVAKQLIPREIVERKKQPYRAPDAASFLVPDAPEYVKEMFSADALKESGIFNVESVSGLHSKCSSRAAAGDGLLSNVDNMGFVGVLSSQLLYFQFIKNTYAARDEKIHFTTEIDRVKTLSSMEKICT